MGDVILKADKDYTKDVDKAIPEAEQLAKVSKTGNLHADMTDICEEQCTRRIREAPGAGEADQTSIRPPIHIQTSRQHLNDMQTVRRLESAQRAGYSPLQEAQSAQTGNHQDGSGCHGVLGRCTKRRDQAVRH